MLKKKIILLIFLINILTIVNSVPVTDLNLYTITSPPFKGEQDINFGLSWTGGESNNIYWADGDVNSITSVANSIIISDDWTDGDYTNNPTWVVQNGTWTAGSNYLALSVSSGNNDISTDYGTTYDFSETGLLINWKIIATNPNSGIAICNTANIAGCDGYRFSVSGGDLKIKRNDSGVETELDSIAGLSIVNGDIIQARIDTNGLIRMYENYIPRIEAIDTTYQGFRYVIPSYWSAGSAMDDLNLTIVDPPVSISSPQYKIFNFSETGLKTIQATVQNIDGNASTSIDFNVFGFLKITAYDENANTPLSNASISFNGNNYNLSTDGNISINLNGITAGEYIITLDVNSEYAQREFLFDLNQYSTIDKNITLLKINQGQNIIFKMYDTDETTLFNTAKIEAIKNNINKTATIKKTNSTGNITLFLQTDSDYNFVITRSNGTSVTYYPTQVTVLPPKREDDATTITPINFGITITGLAQQVYTNQTASKTFAIFSNTVNPYKIFIDVNTGFYQRKYNIQTYGDTMTYELQPYMVSTSSGTSMTLKVQRFGDYIPIPDTTIKIYKYITGEGRVLIENVISDSKGEAFVSGTINDNYDFEVYYNNNLVDNFEITITSTTIYIRFNPLSVVALPDNYYLNVTFSPSGSVLATDTNSLSQSISYLNATITQIKIYAKYRDYNGDISDLNLYSKTITTGIINGYTNTKNISTDLPAWDTNKELLIYVSLTTNSNTFTKKQSYIYQYSVIVNTWDFITRGVKQTLSCQGETCNFLMVLALLISLGVAGSIYSMSPVSESQASILFVILLILFTVIEWIHWALTLATIIITIVYLSSNSGK